MQTSNPENREGTPEEAAKLGLFPHEFELIVSKLERNPTFTELAMFSGMWSEHCSYKNSILLLKTLYSQSNRLLALPGEENAGALRINDEQAVVFKIESHNHPSAVEPYQGAATGVGGIMRDIFTMGARPLVSLNSLRFGHPEDARNRYLLKQVVKGIGDYGNSLGIPVAGGELTFHDSFSKNPLVNAMTVGIADSKKMASARAKGAGNLVIYVGARTGRDGIHGASFASKELSNESQEERSAVQVGDPFMEKLVMEATLEVIEKNLVVAIQDMGAAGLVSSSSEMAASGDMGIDMHTDRIPAREENMEPFEFLLSESQERMLLVVEPHNADAVESVFHKWELQSAVIGELTDTGKLRIFHNDKLYADLPAALLAKEAPRYERETKKPELPISTNHDIRIIDDAISKGNAQAFNETLTQLLGHVNMASKEIVYRQYDTDIGLGRIVGPGQNAGVYRIPRPEGSNVEQALSVTVDGNSFYMAIDPYLGSIHSVAEAWRNISASGAEPIGITNGLNFANPYKPENYFFFKKAIHGMSFAAEAFTIPITGGNVSFYNESEDGPVLPTPMIGMVGLLENAASTLGSTLDESDQLFLIGKFTPQLAASQYAWILKESAGGPLPDVDLQEEKKSSLFLRGANSASLLAGAIDLSAGGFLYGLLRMLFAGRRVFRKDLGITVDSEFLKKTELAQEKSLDSLLFGETAHSYLVAVKPENKEKFLAMVASEKINTLPIGEVSNSGKLTLENVSIEVAPLEEVYETGLSRWFK